MEVSATTKKVLEAKRAKGLSFAELGKLIGRDEVWVAALIYGQARADEDEAKKLKDDYISVEHVLLAFTADGGPAGGLDAAGPRCGAHAASRLSKMRLASGPPR